VFDMREIKYNHKNLERLRKLLTNGAPEWLVLLLTLQHGTIGNELIMREIGADPNWHLSAPRLSQARNKLATKGLLVSVNSTKKFYELPYGLEEQLARLFDATIELQEAIEKNHDATQINRLQKRGMLHKKAGV